MKALCAAAPECAVTELDIQGASDSDYLKAMHSCLDVKNCVGITSWGITDNTVSFDHFPPKNGPETTLTTVPTVVARRQDPSVVQQQCSAQVCLQRYPQRFVSVVSFTASALDGGTPKASRGLYSLQFNLVLSSLIITPNVYASSWVRSVCIVAYGCCCEMAWHRDINAKPRVTWHSL
jgi:hypothetical protein